MLLQILNKTLGCTQDHAYNKIMVKILTLLFTITPLCEIYLLLILSRNIGFLYTLLWVVSTGIAGAILTKYEGLRTMQTCYQTCAQGHIPTLALIEGLLILCGGLLLITPGILTDITGFILLFPISRTTIASFLQNHWKKTISSYHHTKTFQTMDVDIPSYSKDIIDTDSYELNGKT